MKTIKKEFLKPSKENFLKLRKLIETGNENKCRDQFLNFAEILADHHNLELDAVLSEVTASLDGRRADIILCGSRKSDNLKNSLRLIKGTNLSASKKYVIVYECKSPKLPIFIKPKNSSRYFPSSELIEAETQMIEYVHYLTGSTLFKQQMNDLSYSECIAQIGGIVIGKRYEDDQDEATEYETTSALRRKFLYEEAKIHMLSWEEILLWIRKEYKY